MKLDVFVPFMDRGIQLVQCSNSHTHCLAEDTPPTLASKSTNEGGSH